jgi:hypothetical protein
MTNECEPSAAALRVVREWQEKIDASPPMPHAVMAHHSVPYSRVFRQWDARGRLLVWVNRGAIADLPRAMPEQCPPGFPMMALAFGIPVVNA